MRPSIVAAVKTATRVTKVTRDRTFFIHPPSVRAKSTELLVKTSQVTNEINSQAQELSEELPLDNINENVIPFHQAPIKVINANVSQRRRKHYRYAEGFANNFSKLRGKEIYDVFGKFRPEMPQEELDEDLPKKSPRNRRKQIRDEKKAVRQRDVDKVWLRDACDCHMCVDSSTKQKTFQTTDVPEDISVRTKEIMPDGSMKVTWENDVLGFKENHISTYSKDFLEHYRGNRKAVEALKNQTPKVYWNKETISRDITFFEYSEYMSSDYILHNALEQLRIYGLIFIRNVPSTETAVEDIGGRVGNLKDTFYGRTWDVKSVSEAKNVAYTNVSLGFHMDLLYTAEPPGLQLLHCLHNSCSGGASIFSDAFHSAQQIYDESRTHYAALHRLNLTYHYRNAGQHYRRQRPVFVGNPNGSAYDPRALDVVNYSPPFQGPLIMGDTMLSWESVANFREGLSALRHFAEKVEHATNIYEYKMKEGECVVFNNRRVLHARRAFDTGSGKRWLKGAYVDMDVFESKLRVFHEEHEGMKALVPSAKGGNDK